MNAVKGIKGFCTLPIEDRFFNKVLFIPEHECWIWLGSSSYGYGSIYLNGRPRKATHVSWEIANRKPFPKGKFACHSCDNPPCVNPAHIWPGTPRENFDDMMAKGRHRYNAPPKWLVCSRGHSLTDEKNAKNFFNKKLNRMGQRQCRTCANELQNARRALYRSQLSTQASGEKVKEEFTIPESHHVQCHWKSCPGDCHERYK